MAEQKFKEMKLADHKVGDAGFKTVVNIKQVRSKESGRWLTIITIGKDQDKKFMVTARKDGQGTCLLTDWEEYQMVESKKTEVQSI
jgi:hypothetical protein